MYSTVQYSTVPVVVDHVGHGAVVPDDGLPGAAPRSYEGHHEGEAVGVGQLVPPDPHLGMEIIIITILAPYYHSLPSLSSSAAA